MATPRKVGRPQVFDRNKVLAEILDQIIEGVSLVRVLKNGKGRYPKYSQFMQWLCDDKELADKYAKAKEVQADYIAEEILDIADDGTNDWMLANDPENPGYKANGEHLNRSRLRVDTRKWIASHLKPKKYGDRVQNDLNLDEETRKVMTLYVPVPKNRSE